jgi:hypothetical protein
LFLARLLSIAFARQRFFYPVLFAGLKIKRLPLDFLNDVFLLDFSFKAVQAFSRG